MKTFSSKLPEGRMDEQGTVQSLCEHNWVRVGQILIRDQPVFRCVSCGAFPSASEQSEAMKSALGL